MTICTMLGSRWVCVLFVSSFLFHIEAKVLTCPPGIRRHSLGEPARPNISYSPESRPDMYSDILLGCASKHARQNRYQLHAIILSRSPCLAHLISISPKSGGMNTIYVPLESIPEITDQVSMLNISCVNSVTNGPFRN